MSLWLRVRRLHVVGIGLVLLAAACRILGARHVEVPTVIGGGAQALFWVSFLPQLWASVLCLSLASVGAQAELRCRPRLPVLDAGLFATAVCAACLVLMTSGAFDASGREHIVGHVLVTCGLAVSVLVVLGPGRGILAATALLLMTSSYSPRLMGAVYVRLLQPDGDVRVPLVSGGVLCVLALLLLAAPRTSSRRQDEEAPDAV